MSPAEVGALTGAVLGLVTLCGVGWRVAKAAYRLARRIEVIFERSEQLAPNSGSSLYDRVARIHDKVHEASERLDIVEDRLTGHDEKIHRNQGRIEAIALVTSPTMLIEDERGDLRESRREGQGH